MILDKLTYAPVEPLRHDHNRTGMPLWVKMRPDYTSRFLRQLDCTFFVTGNDDEYRMNWMASYSTYKFEYRPTSEEPPIL